ncbi:MAG: hypothetical protein C5B59_01270 [Bacteroidetes bacterium]|nr:MAG: hypothetical protein C5B59_01270 [Bacteroidota bacterium]
MKKTTLIYLGILVFASFGFQHSLPAQTVKDIFNSETPVMYLGIDFTKSKLIDDANTNANDLRDRHYTGINELVLGEPKKYDIKGAIHKSSFDHDLGSVNKRNEKANAEEIHSTNSGDFHRLKEEDIKAMVSGFDFGDKKGLGLLFIMEAMSKSDKAVAVWVTYVDMANKKVLLTDRVEGKLSMGFGVRNYYATGVKNVIDNIEKKKYKEWQAKYGS